MEIAFVMLEDWVLGREYVFADPVDVPVGDLPEIVVAVLEVDFCEYLGRIFLGFYWCKRGFHFFV